MKKAFLTLTLLAAWLASLPAYATTYTYDVNYSFTTTPGSVAGFITTSCDNCVLNGERRSVLVIHGQRRHERQLIESGLGN
jgi:hypothetical protein